MSKYKLPENFTVTAHTGCMGTEANTLESITAGFSSGADIIEIDIRFLPDGTPVLTHNMLSKNQYDKAVRLEEAFNVIKKYPDKKVNIDIKETTNVAEIQRLAEKIGILDQIFFTGVDNSFVDEVNKNCPKIKHYINFKLPSVFKYSTAYISKLIKQTEKTNSIGINLNKALCSKKLVRMFHNKKLLVSIWTITDVKGAKKYLGFTPDNITCKNPDEVIPLIK